MLDREVLFWDRELAVGFGEVILRVDGQVLLRFLSEEGAGKTVKWLTKKFAGALASAGCSLLKFNTPLYDETYKYNREDGRWYLVGRGPGFA